MRIWVVVAVGIMLAPRAFAAECEIAVYVNFVESAPKDSVSVRYEGRAGLTLRSLVWGLRGSQGDLIFDTVSGGAGYNVAQPFEGAGTAKLAAVPALEDGGRQLALSFDEFPPSAAFVFTLDVDDRISGRSGTMIDGTEISGSDVSVVMGSTDGEEFKLTGVFNERSAAVLRGNCVG